MMRGTVRLVVAAFCLLAGLPIGSVEPVCSNAKHLPPPLRRPHHANAGAWGGIDGRRIISRVDAIGGGGGGLGLRLLDRLRGGGQTQLDQAEKNAKEEEERRIAILAEKQKKGYAPFAFPSSFVSTPSISPEIRFLRHTHFLLFSISRAYTHFLRHCLLADC